MKFQYEELLDEYNLLKLQDVQEELKLIVDQYMNQEKYDESKNQLNNMITMLGRFAKSNFKVMADIPTEYFNNYLETYSYYLINNVITLFKLGDYKEAMDMVNYAGKINVKGNSDFYATLDNMAFNLSIKSGEMPKVLFRELYKDGLPYETAVENLKSIINEGLLPS